ncbi:MAG: VOC family protein [Pyrinomonadaceae bacterium]
MSDSNNARSEIRFKGTMDHIAIESKDLKQDVNDYERLGFSLETLYHDWAMLRDESGFGIALLALGSKHPPHIGLRVDSLAELKEAAEKEGRPIKEHRDRSLSFYTKGVGGQFVELIYYPSEYTTSIQQKDF